MKELKIKDNFYQYQFESINEYQLGLNIYVLYNDEECIVFDAGYERNMVVLREKLKDFKINYVICTHFHPDHCYGLNELPKQNLIGSRYSLETLEMFDDLENMKLIPTVLIDDETIINFYDHKITLSLNKGHSNCGMLINIDDEYLLVGDEYMTTNDNLPVLPYVAETITQHIDALTRIIENYEGYTLLPSHGCITKELKELSYRKKYLEFADTKDRELRNFYKKDDIHFINERWHSLNIKK
ncbi:Ribonuclease BN [Candidatus Izimaplasma bacterium HR1]|uniref:MBL fold metallo-hydrolase n=1 Tax=Candidatus Izimoplasma sp. HR1 TaxID=1541959 RepID=UPI0004F88EBC|nr:Ribonuclease BN [Candidatus Izimaplasma bacterium HR1]